MLLYLKTIDILIEKIKQDIHWITEDELNKVIKLYDANTFTGWGRLSHKLLLDIKDSNDNNIMDFIMEGLVRISYKSSVMKILQNRSMIFKRKLLPNAH